MAVASREELGRLRRAELHAAAAVLGVRSVHSLGLPDGALPQADAESLLAGIVHFLRQHRPAVVVTFGPEGGPNSHRDHKVISRVATAAYFLAGLPTAFPEQLERDGLAVHAPRRLYYASWEPPGVGDETLAVQLLKAGVADYVVKHGPRSLGEAALTTISPDLR